MAVYSTDVSRLLDVLSVNPQCGQGYRFLSFLGGVENSFGVNNEESLEEATDVTHVDKKGEMV